MKTKIRKLKGFTLVEMVLYIAISAIILSAIGVMVDVSYKVRARQQVISEVEQQGTEITQIINQVIRNSTLIQVPIAAASGSTLTLTFADGAKNPTTFDLSGTTLRISEGGGSAVSLNNSKVQISDLSFSNLSQASTPGTVKFSFTVSYYNPGGNPQYNYQQIFYGSASLR